MLRGNILRSPYCLSLRKVDLSTRVVFGKYPDERGCLSVIDFG